MGGQGRRRGRRFGDLARLHLLPDGRREAAVRFAVGVVCGLVFGGTAGLKIAVELGIDRLIGADRDDADGIGGGEPLRLVGARRRSLRTLRAQRLRPQVLAADMTGECLMNADAIWHGVGERKFVDLVLDEVEPDGVFSGYASLFGTVDLGKDVVERGAFAASLQARGAAGIRMLFQHDPAEPIGVWTEIAEDARGLFVRGRLAKDVGRAREVLALMRGGALDGLSIGFRAVQGKERSAASGVRRILEVDLWEISVVTFPMLPERAHRHGEGQRGGCRRHANSKAGSRGTRG